MCKNLFFFLEKVFFRVEVVGIKFVIYFDDLLCDMLGLFCIVCMVDDLNILFDV